MSRLQLFILMLTGFIDYLGVGLVYPVFAALLFDTQDPILAVETSLAFRGAMLGILIALTPISQFFVSPILGSFSDRKGRKKALILGISAGCIGYILAIIGICNHSLGLLFLYRAFVGIADATASVAQAALSDISTDANKGRRFSLLNSSLGFGFTVGPFLGGKLADPTVASWCGYALPFIVAGCMTLINLLLVVWKFPETRKIFSEGTSEVTAGIRHIGKVFLWKKFRWLFIAGFGCAFGWSFFNEFIPVLLRSHFGFSLNEVGNYYACTGGWYAFWSAVLAAPLFMIFQSENWMSKLFFGSAVMMLLFTVLTTSFAIWWILPVMMFCVAIVYPGLTAIVSNRADSETQGEVLGVYQAVQAAAMGLSPLIVGSAVGTYPALAALGGAVAMVGAGIACWIGTRAYVYKTSTPTS